MITFILESAITHVQIIISDMVSWSFHKKFLYYMFQICSSSK
jgi:hypothetical protein